jgi:hypothetical protein
MSIRPMETTSIRPAETTSILPTEMTNYQGLVPMKLSTPHFCLYPCQQNHEAKVIVLVMCLCQLHNYCINKQDVIHTLMTLDALKAAMEDGILARQNPVRKLSRSLHEPTMAHEVAMHKAMRYCLGKR